MDYINGVDVSHWQGEILWDKLVAAGPKYCFIRAGSCNINTGVCYKDWEFDRNRVEGPARLPCGPYWFFRAEHNPITQAQYFWNITSLHDWKLPLVCDVETNAGGLGRYEFSNSLRKFLAELERLSGRRPIIYTNRNFDSFVESSSLWGTYDLWVANYTLDNDPDMPTFWKIYKWWQWSADRPPTANTDGWLYGCPGSTAIDKNRFPGTWEDFLAYIKADVEEPPDPPPDPPEEPDPPHEIFLPYVVNVNAQAGLFTRKTPEIANNKAGALFNNTEVTVIEEDGAWRKCKAEYWSHGNYLTRV